MTSPRCSVMLFATLMVTLALFASQANSTYRRPRYWYSPRFSYAPRLGPDQCGDMGRYTPRCGVCGPRICVTITARNVLVEPNFEITTTIKYKPQRELLFFLEEAVEQDNGFKFESTYFANLGYFINSINGLRGSTPDQTFWSIIGPNGSLQCGVSTFIPINGDSILFNFTTFSTHP